MSVGGHALAGVLAMSPWEAVEVAGVREVTVGLVGDCWGPTSPSAAERPLWYVGQKLW